MYLEQFNCQFCKKLLEVNRVSSPCDASSSDDVVDLVGGVESTFVCRDCCNIEDMYVEFELIGDFIERIIIFNSNYILTRGEHSIFGDYTTISKLLDKTCSDDSTIKSHSVGPKSRLNVRAGVTCRRAKQIFFKSEYNIFKETNINPTNFEDKIKLLLTFQ
jgi:hypothetical protein